MFVQRYEDVVLPGCFLQADVFYRMLNLPKNSTSKQNFSQVYNRGAVDSDSFYCHWDHTHFDGMFVPENNNGDQ